MTAHAFDAVLAVAESTDSVMTLQTLKARLQALGSVAHLVLDASLCSDVCALLGDALGINAIPLDLPHIDYGDDSITITGQATLWQEPPMPVTLKFANTAAGWQFTLRSGDSAGHPTLRLNALAAHVLPGVQGIPDLALDQLAISAIPQAKQLSLYMAVRDAWDVPLGVTALRVGDVQLQLTYVHDAVPKLRAALSGSTTIGHTVATVTATFGQEVALACTIPHLDFPAISQTFLPGMALPDGLPALAFADVELHVAPKNGAFSFYTRSANPWDIGLGGFTIEQTDLAISGVAGAIQGTLTVDSAGPVALNSDTRLEKLLLAFDFAQGQSWSASGSLSAVLFDHAFDLEVEVDREEVQTFRCRWNAHDPVTLVDVTDLATLSVDALAFSIVRQTVGNAWALTSNGQLHVPHVIEHAAGSLEIEHNEVRTGLAFLTDEGTISVTLPIATSQASQAVRFSANPQRIAIGRQRWRHSLHRHGTRACAGPA